MPMTRKYIHIHCDAATAELYTVESPDVPLRPIIAIRSREAAMDIFPANDPATLFALAESLNKTAMDLMRYVMQMKGGKL